jgi:thiosulfate/3-mercaptopyruvate sulfurtransferase
LAQRLDAPHLRILDARLPDSYAEGHIPSALHIDLAALRTHKGGVDGMLIESDAFAAIMGRLGIDQDTGVVIYDDYYGQLAARIAWSLRRFGHDSVALLDGGWDAWEADGLPVSADTPQPTPTRFTPTLADGILAEHEWVREHLHAPDVLLLDVRADAEYHKGHLPDAVLWNWENGIAPDSTFRADDVLPELARVGVTPDKEIVTYCQSGMRAAHTYWLLRQLGFERVRMYDGSWAEWSYREGNKLHAG